LGIGLIVKCNSCGKEFEIREGGGFTFHLLHCDRCGAEKMISFDELGDIHLRYIKGLDMPYSIATMEGEKDIKENYPGEPISEDEYHKLVEEYAGVCDCGGHFRFDASQQKKCPYCGSIDISYTGELNNYD